MCTLAVVHYACQYMSSLLAHCKRTTRSPHAAAGPLSLLPPGASPHAIAALLKQFLLGLPEPLLTYR